MTMSLRGTIECKESRVVAINDVIIELYIVKFLVLEDFISSSQLPFVYRDIRPPAARNSTYSVKFHRVKFVATIVTVRSIALSTPG